MRCQTKQQSSLHRRASALIKASWTRWPGVWHAVLFFLGLYIAITVYAFHGFQGNWWGFFLPGRQFGVPEREVAQGIRPVCEVGWDGQFYYYQSNDPWALRDASAHIDTPPYRYQRNGVPLLAHLTARLLGHDFVTAHHFQVIQLGLFAIGLGVLVSWLREHGLSAVWAYGWALGAGTLNALLHGLPDGVGDAMFIMALVAVLRGQVVLYVLSATLLLLVRESYAVVAGMVFLVSILGHLAWKRDKQSERQGAPVPRLLKHLLPAEKGPGGVPDSPGWARVWLSGPHALGASTATLLLIPLMVFMAWQCYVTHRFGQSGSQSAAGVILTYPFWAMLQAIYSALSECLFSWGRHLKPLVLVLLGAIIFLAGFVAAWRCRSKAIVIWIVFPYLGILTLMSSTVWCDWSGYLKAMGSVVALMIILLPWYQPRWIHGLLLVCMIWGTIHVANFSRRHLFAPYPDCMWRVVSAGMQEGFVSSFNPELSVNELGGMQFSGERPHGLFAWFSRDCAYIPVRVRNCGRDTWWAMPQDGKYAFRFTCEWFRAGNGRRVSCGRLSTSLSQDVLPDGMHEQLIAVGVPPPGQYRLQLSMYQVGSLSSDVKVCCDLPITIPEVPRQVWTVCRSESPGANWRR